MPNLAKPQFSNVHLDHKIRFKRARSPESSGSSEEAGPSDQTNDNGCDSCSNVKNIILTNKIVEVIDGKATILTRLTKAEEAIHTQKIPVRTNTTKES